MGRALLAVGIGAIVAAVAASCATSTATPPTGTGGTGGTGGGTTPFTAASNATTTSTGGGGAPPIDDGGPAPVDAGACAPFVETFTPGCLTCLASSCCSEGLACYAVHDCFGYTSCQQNCPISVLDGGNPCLMECAQNFPMAEPTFGMMTACLHQSCAMVCPY
jgi:hypothetical protein